MKKIKFKFNLLILVLLLLQPFVSPELFSCIVLMLDVYFIIKYKKVYYKNIVPGFLIFFFFIFYGGMIALINISSYRLKDIVRDIYYVVNAISVLYLGFCISKDNKPLQYKFNSIIMAAIIIGLYTIIDFIAIRNDLSGIGEVNKLRREISSANIYCCTLTIYLFIFTKRNKNSLNNMINLSAFLISLIAFIVSLSRTNLLILGILTLVNIFYSSPKKFVKNVFITGFALIISLIVFTYLLPNNIVSDYMDKILSSFTEINSSNDWREPSVIQSNWRGYENYCAIQELKNGTLFDIFFGFGYGKKVYVDFYATSILGHLEDGLPTNSIPVLHNGYFTMLIKNGIVGLVVYISLFIKMLSNAKKKIYIEKRSFNSVFLFGLVLSMVVITYFLNGFFKDTYILSIIILLPVLFNYKPQNSI